MDDETKSELDQSIENRLSARDRFKKAVTTVAKVNFLPVNLKLIIIKLIYQEFHAPTRDEQFEFFCKQWGEPEKEKDEPKMAKIAKLAMKKEKEKTDEEVSYNYFYYKISTAELLFQKPDEEREDEKVDEADG